MLMSRRDTTAGQTDWVQFIKPAFAHFLEPRNFSSLRVSPLSSSVVCRWQVVEPLSYVSRKALQARPFSSQDVAHS